MHEPDVGPTTPRRAPRRPQTQPPPPNAKAPTPRVLHRMPIPKNARLPIGSLAALAGFALVLAALAPAPARAQSAAPAGAAAAVPGFTFETNPTLNVLHFMHTAIGGEHASQSYRTFIDSATAGDDAFNELVTRYSQLDFSSGYRRPNLPRRRYRARTVMDFLWLHASVARSRRDFSQRTFGLLPVADHTELFDVLAEAEPYYQRLVAIPQRANIERTERFLDAYEGRVAQLFGRISDFYGTPWPASIPFTVALCPIPLSHGVTSAVPKVSTLVCSYLAENDDDYKATLGVAVHEMCHSIYDEQPTALQRDIDDWFTLSLDPSASYAYAYFNEAVATAVGNGWAYEQLNARADEDAWYADPFIDGYARALYPLVKAYLTEGQTMDRAFVTSAIEAFAKTFPDARRDPAVLLSRVGIYADTEDDAVLQRYSDELFRRFRVSSSFLRAPLESPGALRSMGYPQLTKVVIVDRNRAERWGLLAGRFAHLGGTEVPDEANASYAFYDEASRSPVIVLLVQDAEGLGTLLEVLKQQDRLPFNEVISVGARLEARG